MTMSHILAPYASNCEESRGRQLKSSNFDPDDLRTVFERDRDRIIHCGAFRKLKHKTQVFIYHEGDYFRTRLTHSLEVAQIARAIARRLRLDADLAETIALAHDLGHPPFGHAGESTLDEAMKNYGGFDHNEQACRIFTQLEHCYAEFDGLNLTWESIEGIVKHNGPELHPRPTIKALDAHMNLQLNSYASLEAQVAALADDIAYITHDFDDGIRAGLLKRQDMLDLPLAGKILHDLYEKYGELETSRLVHELTRRLIGLAVSDLCRNTGAMLADAKLNSADEVRDYGQPLVAFSSEMKKNLDSLRQFLFASVWRHYKVNRMTSKAKRVVRQLFDLFMAESTKSDLHILPLDWQMIGDKHLTEVTEEEVARHIADYMAGMTDRYALLEYERLFDLKPILR